MIPKPEKRAPRPRKRIARGSRPRKQRRAKKGPTAQRRAERRLGVTAEDAVWSAKVKVRAGGYCQCGDCFARDGEVAHHLWPKGRYPHMRHVVENGAWLRVVCHRRVHSEGLIRFRRWFLGEAAYWRLQEMAAD